MEKLIRKLRQDFSQFTFAEAAVASWSPERQQISYKYEDTEVAAWTMLHELGHALLQHRSFASDIDLLQKEVAAWERARRIAGDYGIHIHDEHIQQCLDTYRDWLHKRSTCPTCRSQGLQPSTSLYRCPNCQTSWKVSASRFCRPYRLRTADAAT